MAKWLQKMFKKQSIEQAESKARTCPRCGFGEVEPEANFCRKCGVDLRKEKKSERSI